MAYNIQMNYYDGSSYQELNPRTLLANVTDWNNSVYSKSEMDTNLQSITTSFTQQLQELDNKISPIISGNIAPWTKFQTKTVTLNRTVANDSYSSTEILFPSNLYALGKEDCILTVSNMKVDVTYTTTGHLEGNLYISLKKEGDSDGFFLIYSRIRESDYSGTSFTQKIEQKDDIILASTYGVNTFLNGNNGDFTNDEPLINIDLENLAMQKFSYASEIQARYRSLLDYNKPIQLSTNINRYVTTVTVNATMDFNIYKRAAILGFRL